MRLTPLIAAALTLSMTGSAFAQEWTEFVSREDGFKLVFPGQPRVQDFIYVRIAIGCQRAPIAPRVGGIFSITVVDYRGIENKG
jgi:hypothetical protein